MRGPEFLEHVSVVLRLLGNGPCSRDAETCGGILLEAGLAGRRPTSLLTRAYEGARLAAEIQKLEATMRPEDKAKE